jgi:hypothetical protein
LGWILQTNAVDVGNNLDWGDVPSSENNYQVTFPTTNSTSRTEFFRLRYP